MWLVVSALPGVSAAQSFGVQREMWTNLTTALGATLAALTNTTYNPNWPTNPVPEFTAVYTNFETATTTGINNYGQRLRAFVVPPADGYYTFWIASDDSSQVAVSSDENPSNAVMAAWVTGFTSARQWTKYTNQQSAPVLLNAGCRHYVEVLMQQGGGGDNLCVRWQTPGGIYEEPLTATGALGTILIPCNGIEGVPGIFRQPASTTVVERSSVLFTTLVTNTAPVDYQWFVNGVASAGSTRAGFALTNVPPALSGWTFRCVASNASGVVTSQTATLTVIADTNAPVLTRVFNVGPTNVQLRFSEPLQPAGATNTANYVFTNGGVSVSAAALAGDAATVTLTVSPLVYGSNYWIVLNNLRDLAASSNSIATNTQAGFVAMPYVQEDIGVLATGSTMTVTGSNACTVTAAGCRNPGATSDQAGFFWEPRTGDFDVKVRMAAVGLADAWSRAGLMARQDLTDASPFAAAFATPSIAGSYFENRAAAGGATVMSGSAPVNYPQTWLRLQRQTNTFRAYAGFDGKAWLTLGSTTITSMPAICYLGLVASSHVTNQPMTAQFRDIAEATGSSTASFSFPVEALGPSSRRTGLVFSEFMYNPPPQIDGRNLEFVEIFNSSSFDEDLTGHRLSGDISYAFPSGTVLRAGAFLVVARVPGDVEAVHGLAGVLGPYTNGLSNNGGMLRLRGELGQVLLEVNYNDRPPWPVAADGAGHSLVLARASYGEDDPRAWAASDTFGGTPGAWNTFTTDPLDGVVINEFLAHTDPPLEDFVELYNHNNEPKDLSGAWLSDTIGTNLFRIPNGTVLPARGFLAFIETQLGFRLDATGEQILLVNSNGTRVLDAIDFNGQENGVSSGRVPDGGPGIYRLAARSAGTNNGAWRQPDVVINELMFDPISGRDDDQYIELYNRGSSNVNLTGWRLEDGVDFTFPSNTVIPAGGHLVIAENATNLLARYPHLGATNCLGNFSGALAGGGERIALSFPDDVVATNGVTNVAHIVVSEVTYNDGGRWGDWAAGDGSSLELIDPDANTRLPDSWADSDETVKTSAWVAVEYTQNLGETVSSPVNDNLHLYLLGRGECLVDDVELLSNGVPVVVTNGNFEAGLAGWTAQGAYDQTTAEAGGYSGAQCLHVRGCVRGDTGANRIRSPPFPPLPAGTPVTIRAKARWVRGWPELLIRMHGGSIEVPVYLPPPASGTPGQRNSRHVTNAGPAIVDVKFSPILPAFGESVVVSARPDDPDGVAGLALQYRVDPVATYTALTMRDDGTGGDTIAGDGVYGATLPAQSTTNIIAFFVRGVDVPGASNNFPRVTHPSGAAPRLFPSDSTSKECLVRWGEVQMPAGFASYHLWLTKANRDRWAARDNLNNADVDGTFVYNNSRVVLNAGMQFGGSPFHRGLMTTGPDGGNRCDFVVHAPDDDRVLGVTDFNLGVPGNGGFNTCSDLSALLEHRSMYTFRKVGVPYMHRRHIHLFVNGSQRSAMGSLPGHFVYEDVQQPNSEILREWHPDAYDGQLYKIEDWFEFNDAATSFGNNDADIHRRLIPASTNINFAPYRFMWRLRSIGTGQSASDYSSFRRLLDCLAPTVNNYEAVNVPLFQHVADVDEWFREMAAQRVAGNYDSYGWDRGKNNFLYFVPGGRAVLMPWDVDQVRPYDNTIYGSNDKRMETAQKTAPILRLYMQAFRDIFDGPHYPGVMESFLDERTAAFTANGISFSAAAVNTQKWYVAARRNYIEAQMAVYQTNFSIRAPTNNAQLNSNFVTITGTAPIEVSAILVNGETQQVTWVTNNVWTVRLALGSTGTNVLRIASYDRRGNLMTNATSNLIFVVNGGLAPPAGSVVFNEIAHAPALTNAQYVELFNTSSNTAFNLSGWSVNGLGYTFPPGSVIAPRAWLLLAKDRYAMLGAHGTGIPVFDQFEGTLDPDGETLSLLMNDAQTTVVDRVRYEAAAPWAVNTNGASLQLVDATNDNSRVSNWRNGQTNAPAGPAWVYFAATGTFSSTTLYVYLGSAGDLYLDDIRCVTGTVDAGTSYVTNGGFESPLSPPWITTANFTNSVISTNFARSGAASLHLIASAAGSGSGNSIRQTLTSSFASTTPTVISFWYLQNTNGGPVTVRLSNSGTAATTDPALPPSPPIAELSTPGRSNSIAASYSAYPAVWLNEVQPSNTSVLVDNAGEREPWVELYNGGTGTLSLAGLYLSDGYTNLTRWAFPTNATIPPNAFRLVWCDAQTNQTATNALHANFRLPAAAGRVALSRMVSNTPQVVDYLTYSNVLVNWSYGDFPDGQPFYRRQMFVATPGATNNGATQPITVLINEWMADNESTLADPSDGQFEDWFEFYNPGSSTVDLGGYYLTDNLNAKTKFLVPATGRYTIPPHGFLLVWADNETGQNSTNVPDLHVNFSLSKDGESLGIFASDGTALDSVTFGAQTANVSEGRYRDGAALLLAMPPTPRTNNNIFNTAPAVGALTNRFLYVGQALHFTATAVDAESAYQSVAYSLVSGAPAGASIHPVSGAFVWNITNAAFAGTTNLIAIRATDDGIPPLSGTNSLLVVVLDTAAWTYVGPQPTGTTVEIVFDTAPGQTYRVEYKASLEDPAWEPLGAPIAGDGNVFVFVDDLAANTRRFYRLVAVP